MSVLKLSRNRFIKTTGLPGTGFPSDVSKRVTAIVTVTAANYVPEHVSVRSRIDPVMFTAEFDDDVLVSLEADDKVKSIAVSEPLHIVE